jgi:glutathione synthase/RimK-type ligase-like ATP-grasp enzyme
VDWAEYDHVIVRSIWDYHLHYPRFLEWLDALDQCGVAVSNATALLRWNASKTYLLEIEAAGAAIVPTRINPANLADVLEETGWRDIVIKPVVGASGFETWTCAAPAGPADEQRYAAQRRERDMLVQQFVPGVRLGERSYVFIDGQYSHAVMKHAAPGEFRVHVEHGGTVAPYSASPAEIEWAREVVRCAPFADWLYARVDAIDSGDALLVMELEMLDPELFFSYDRAAAHTIADAILADRTAP